METIYIVIIILIVIYVIYSLYVLAYNILYKKQSFEGRPSDIEISNITNQINKNPEVFNEGLAVAKKRYKWIDPITYEDIRKRLRTKNTVSPDEINNMF